MKTLLNLALLLSFAAGHTSLAAAASRPAAAPSAVEFKPFVLNLKPGSSPAEVRSKLGAPHAMLGADLWIYWNYGAPNPNSANPAFDTLVIAFTDNRVTAVKITDARAVRQLLANAQPAKDAAGKTDRAAK